LMNLLAEAEDEETAPSNLDYSWQLILHHNTHFHYLDVTEGNNQTILLSPTGCSESETYWYEFALTVTDSGGLFDTDSVEIYPDCDGVLETPSLEDPFILFPNPVSGNRLNLLSGIDLGTEVKYEFYDSNGKFCSGGTVQIFNQTRYTQFNIRSLSEGVYTLRLVIKGEEYTSRFVVTSP